MPGVPGWMLIPIGPFGSFPTARLPAFVSCSLDSDPILSTPLPFQELFMRPAPLSEFIHTCTLLSEQALINVVGGSTGAGGGKGRAGGFGASASGQQQQYGKISLKVRSSCF